MRPILLAPPSVNQRLPSGPVTTSFGPLLSVGRGISVIVPVGVMRPIWLLVHPLELETHSVNQRLPSGPAVMPPGELLAVGIGNSVMMPAGLGVDAAVRGITGCEPHAATMTAAVTRSAVSVLFFITFLDSGSALFFCTLCD